MYKVIYDGIEVFRSRDLELTYAAAVLKGYAAGIDYTDIRVTSDDEDGEYSWPVTQGEASINTYLRLYRTMHRKEGKSYE